MEEKYQGQPWIRQPDESVKAYDAFAIYRDLGKERSLPKVAEKCNKNVSLIARWSQKHKWVERATAWDDEVDRQAAEEHLKDIAKARARQRKMAVKMQAKGLELMADIRTGDAKLSEIVSLLKLGMEQERICMGDVGEVVENRDGGTTKDPVTFYIPDNGRDKPEEAEEVVDEDEEDEDE